MKDEAAAAAAAINHLIDSLTERQEGIFKKGWPAQIKPSSPLDANVSYNVHFLIPRKCGKHSLHIVARYNISLCNYDNKAKTNGHYDIALR